MMLPTLVHTVLQISLWNRNKNHISKLSEKGNFKLVNTWRRCKNCQKLNLLTLPKTCFLINMEPSNHFEKNPTVPFNKGEQSFDL